MIMYTRKKIPALSILVALTFLLMITVNALANILPIAGATTGDVSNAYPNLFAPAGITFSIWGVIYLLLAFYTLYQLGIFQKQSNEEHAALVTRIGNLFAFSSIVNTLWIFSWHYQIIMLSMVLMLLILFSLINIHLLLKDQVLSKQEYFFIRLPFSVYFGWITVATIANATVLFVDLGWKGFGLSEPIWASALIVIGMLLGITVSIRSRDAAYNATLIWAYLGILIKHTSATGFNQAYMLVVRTVQISLVLLVVSLVFILFTKKSQRAYKKQ